MRESGAGFDECQRRAPHQVPQAVDKGRVSIVQAQIGAGGPQPQDLRPQTAQFLRFLTAPKRQCKKLIRAGEEGGEVQSKGPDGLAMLHDREALAVGAVSPPEQASVLQRFQMTAQLTIGEALGAEAERFVAGIDREQGARSDRRLPPIRALAGQAAQQRVEDDDRSLPETEIAAAGVDRGHDLAPKHRQKHRLLADRPHAGERLLHGFGTDPPCPGRNGRGCDVFHGNLG